MKQHNQLKQWLESLHYTGTEWKLQWLESLNYAGTETELRELKGTMYGNDSCFDTNEFYQYFLTDNGELYKAYYEIPDGCDDFSEIDYSKPYRMAREDEQYIIDFCL